MTDAPAKKTWGQTIAAYGDRSVLGMLFLGFSAGLPFSLIFGTLSRWLAEEGVSVSTIGLFSLTGIAYGFKFCWAPLVDRLPLPGLHRALGRRRSWIFLAQIFLALGIAGLALLDPKTQLWSMALMAVIVGFASATQDIAIDAWRIETAKDEAMLGAMAGAYQLGYRIALLLAGAGVFFLVEYLQLQQNKSAWPIAYFVMAGFVILAMAATFWVREPAAKPKAPAAAATGAPQSLGVRLVAWFYDAVVNPFVDFFARNRGWALLILLLIGSYWLSDRVWGVMAQPFYLKLGFDKSEIAVISKSYGLIMSIAGALIGSAAVVRYGIMRPLLVCAVLMALTNLLFGALALMGKSTVLLTAVISAENLAGGAAGTALIAYLSSLTNTAYTGTQYALFTSLMVLPGKLIAGTSGFVVEAVGYPWFFVYTAVLGLPAIAIVIVLMRWRPKPSPAALPAAATASPPA